MKSVLMILILFSPNGEQHAGYIAFDTMAQCLAELPARRAKLLAEWQFDYVLVCAEVNPPG